VQSLGVEVAAHNVQVNAIAQNFVDNPTYFPPEVQADPRFQERLKREVPLGRLVSASEDAEFAAYLCSDRRQLLRGAGVPGVRGVGAALVVQAGNPVSDLFESNNFDVKFCVL
jgi:2-keto-3-deoxy-L-fuconate dehydrogenase